MATDSQKEEGVQIEIPNIANLMALSAEDFVSMTMRALSRYQTTQFSRSFSAVSRGLDDYILTPLDNGTAVYYTKKEETFIAAGVCVNSEFKKTGAVSPVQRGKFLTELTKDALRNFEGVPQNSKDYKDLCDQVLEHVSGQLKNFGASTGYNSSNYNVNYSMSTEPVAKKDTGGSAIPIQTIKTKQKPK